MLFLVDLARSCSVVRASNLRTVGGFVPGILEKELFLQPNHTCIQATAWVVLEETEKIEKQTEFVESHKHTVRR